MKIYKNPIRFIAVFISISLATACSDFLDEEDESNFTTDTYFTKAEHAESAVNGIYQPLIPITESGFGGGTWLMLEFATGLANTSLGQATNIYLVKDLINNSDNGYGSSYCTYIRGLRPGYECKAHGHRACCHQLRAK